MPKPIRRVPIEVSARHVHLSRPHVERLFGKEAVLKPLRRLSQPDQFLANRRLTIKGPRGALFTIAIVGPERKKTQVELALTDVRFLGTASSLRLSGDLASTPGGVTLIGPKGTVRLTEGTIVAKRHLHIAPEQARKWRLRHHQTISVLTAGKRPVTFHDVIVRAQDGIDALALHLDTDEGNAAGCKSGDWGVIV